MIEPQCPDKHDQSEQSPHRKIRRHRGVVGGRAPTKFCQHNQRDERKPEQPVGNKSGGGKRVAFSPLHHARNDLRDTTVTNTHRQNHSVEFVKAGVVKIEQHRGHAETEETQRRGIASNVAGFVHGISLSKTRSTRQQQIDWQSLIAAARTFEC